MGRTNTGEQLSKKDFEMPQTQLNSHLDVLLKDKLGYKLDQQQMLGAYSCLGAAIAHLKLVGQGITHFEITKYSLDHYLRLDCAALAALNVFPQNDDLLAGSAASLFGLLNRCKTQIGVRLLKKWLKQPTTSAN